MENLREEGGKKFGHPAGPKVAGTWWVEVSEVEAEGAYEPLQPTARENAGPKGLRPVRLPGFSGESQSPILDDSRILVEDLGKAVQWGTAFLFRV